MICAMCGAEWRHKNDAWVHPQGPCVLSGKIFDSEYDVETVNIAFRRGQELEKRWKEEALAVMPPLQEIAKELGIPLGKTIHDKILPGIIRLKQALEGSKIKHYSCEDSWYSCPKDVDGCSNNEVGPECNCGADQHNAKIDAALAGNINAVTREDKG